jgi:hypothetical protein
MTPNVLKTAILLCVALATNASLAEGINDKPPPEAKATNPKTRTDVKAELQQAKQDGLKPVIADNYPASSGKAAPSTTTRQEVKAKITKGGNSDRDSVKH